MKHARSAPTRTRRSQARPGGQSAEKARKSAARPLLLREAHGPLPDEASLPNLLILGDNLDLLHALKAGPLRDAVASQGGIKLAYFDPPFAVGSDFFMHAGPGSPGALAYHDVWERGLEGYLFMMRERLAVTREVLAPDGSLFLHCDSRVSHHLRLMLDELFGARRFLGEIIWHYTGGGRAKRWFSRKHDSIFHYALSGAWYFDPDAVRVPYKEGSGYAKNGITSARGKRYLPHPGGTPVDDVWDIPMVNPMAAERCGYPTQKPLALLERILAACSRPGDLVADFFCGSGTLAVAASRLGRRWLCADSSPLAISSAVSRLHGLAERPAFALAVTGGGAAWGGAGSEFQTVLPSGNLRYRLEPRFTLEKNGDIRRVRLDGLGVTVCGQLPEGLAVPVNGLDWLASWSVAGSAGPDFASDALGVDSLSKAVVWRARHCQKHGIDLCTPELPRENAAFAALEDVFGNRLCLPLESGV